MSELKNYNHSQEKEDAKEELSDILGNQEDLIDAIVEKSSGIEEFKRQFSIFRQLDKKNIDKNALSDFLIHCMQERAFIHELREGASRLPKSRKDEEFRENIADLIEYNDLLTSAIGLGQGVLSQQELTVVRNNLPEFQYPDVQSVKSQLDGMIGRLGKEFTSELKQAGNLVSITVKSKGVLLGTIVVPLKSKAPVVLTSVDGKIIKEFTKGGVFNDIEDVLGVWNEGVSR